MSLTTWKAEFYPTEASEAAGSDLEATRHSLRKWEGLRAEALEKHDMGYGGGASIVGAGGSAFTAGSSECALCQRYELLYGSCAGCPLLDTMGTPCGDDDSPYSTFVYGGDEEPMIAALRETLARLEAAQSPETAVSPTDEGTR